MISLILVGMTVIIVAAMFFFGVKSGKNAKHNEEMEHIIDDIHIVKTARDNLLQRPSMHDKLRDKYTRK